MQTQRGSERVRVLLVDDDPGVVDLAETYFERVNGRFELVTETSAGDALERIRASEESFDCVVSDYEMPDMDGLQFESAVRDLCADVPFILFTGRARELFDDRPEGVTDLLPKTGIDGGYDELVRRVSSVAGAEAT